MKKVTLLIRFLIWAGLIALTAVVWARPVVDRRTALHDSRIRG